MPCWRKVLVLSHDTMTPVQKQQNPISKHRYVQAPKGFFGYFEINLQVVKIHPPVTSLGKFAKKLSVSKVQLLDSHSRNSNFSMDRTACWQCCSGPSPRERTHHGRGVLCCYTSGDPNSVCLGRPGSSRRSHWFIHIYIPCHANRATLLMCERWNVSMEWVPSGPAKLSARWQKGKRAGSACVNKCCFVVAGRTAVFGCNRTAGFSVLDGDQLHWDQYHWTVSKIQPPYAWKSIHFATTATSSAEGSYLTSFKRVQIKKAHLKMAYTPAMILTLQQVSWSLNKTAKRFSRDFSLFPRTVGPWWLGPKSRDNLPGASLAKLPIFSECAANTHPENSLSTLGHWSPVLQIGRMEELGPGTIYNHDLRKNSSVHASDVSFICRMPTGIKRVAFRCTLVNLSCILSQPVR